MEGFRERTELEAPNHGTKWKRIMSISDGTPVVYTLEFEYRYYFKKKC